MTSKNLSDIFWVEVVACVAYILNCTHTSSLENITPSEVWSKFNTVKHFKTFGCLAYSHILDQRRTKLDNKSEKVIFIGYIETSKAYKLYNPKTKKVILSRDVVFDENKTWDELSDKDKNGRPILNNDEDQEETDDENITKSLIITPTTTIQNNPLTQDPSMSSASCSSRTPVKKTKTLTSIYENTQRLDFDEFFDFVFFADADPIRYEDACQEKR